jgi:RND family efflux transporter MFP subunit
MRRGLTMFTASGIVVVLGIASTITLLGIPRARADSTDAAPPALTVQVTQAQVATLPIRISANGDIAAWQEASVGTEASGLRLAEVNVNVGDRVHRGQQLAAFNSDTLQAEAAQTQAALAEARATAADATANAGRAESLKATGAMSDAAIRQYLTAAATARARVDAQRALARTQKLRLAQARVLAPDDGIVSARHATVGAVAAPGQELFRLIRGGRLEWRAQVASADLAALSPGMPVRVTVDTGTVLQGTVRMVAPTVDPRSRNGVVYVDLPQEGAISGEARAGMFAQGEFELGANSGITLPQGAVQFRDGFGYVLRVGPDSRLTELKVGVGRRLRDRIEITHGIAASARVVAAGGSFLADGDTVRVVDLPLAAPTATAASASAP